jgi:hypothetical protein
MLGLCAELELVENLLTLRAEAHDGGLGVDVPAGHPVEEPGEAMVDQLAAPITLRVAGAEPARIVVIEGLAEPGQIVGTLDDNARGRHG